MLVIRWANVADFAGRLIKPRSAREHHRVRAHNLLRFYNPFAEFPEAITNIVNISETGLQVTVSSKLKVGMDIQMVINLVERNQDIPVRGKVMWVKAVTSKGKSYRVGVKFEEIDAEHRRLLRSIVTERKTA